MRGYSEDNFDKDKAKDALNENLGKEIGRAHV